MIRITGKSEAIQELERAQKLIDEAGKILWKLPSAIHLEITEGKDEATDCKEK